MKSFLHVGCGRDTKKDIPIFSGDEWREVRLDINPDVKPDVVGSTTDMSAIASESMDAIYSAHNIEHLYSHEVELALKEFLRVLRPTGYCVVTCPDLQGIGKLIAEDKLLDAAYMAPAGPITPIDVLYGYRPAIKAGNHFMAHRCGFTLSVLLGTLKAAGFKSAAGFTRVPFELWAVGRKDKLPDAEMSELVKTVFAGSGFF